MLSEDRLDPGPELLVPIFTGKEPALVVKGAAVQTRNLK